MPFNLSLVEDWAHITPQQIFQSEGLVIPGRKDEAFPASLLAMILQGFSYDIQNWHRCVAGESFCFRNLAHPDVPRYIQFVAREVFPPEPFQFGGTQASQ